MDIPPNAHILVMDGGKMLFFKNEGDVAAPRFKIVEQREQDSAATRDQGSSSPGTNHESMGARRSSYEQTDFHQQDEDQFAVDAADMLKREVLAHHIDDLIIVAAPRTLGELRKHFHGEVQKRVIGEISRDVVARPIDEIMATIADN
ncbi:host attachment protein [soil metagenome]|jgi:protein required for attachment to host cells